MRSTGRVLFLLALGAWALPVAAQQKPNDKNQAKLAKEVAANPG